MEKPIIYVSGLPALHYGENTYIGGRQQEPLSMFNPEYKFRTRSRCLTAVSLYRDEDQLCVCLNGFLLSVYKIHLCESCRKC